MADYRPYSAQPLDRLLTNTAGLRGDIGTLIAAIERLIGEVIGLRLELTAMRERWKSGSTTPDC